MTQSKGSAAAAQAVPESADDWTRQRLAFLAGAEQQLQTARGEAEASARRLLEAAPDAPPEGLAVLADDLVSAAGALWARAHRAVEARAARR